MCEKVEKVNITLPLKQLQLEFLFPSLSASLVNAFYSALLLKKLCGVEITAEISKETRAEVLDQLGKIQEDLEERIKREMEKPSA